MLLNQDEKKCIGYSTLFTFTLSGYLNTLKTSISLPSTPQSIYSYLAALLDLRLAKVHLGMLFLEFLQHIHLLLLI